MKSLLSLILLLIPTSLLFSQACSPPQISAFALTASCTNDIPNNDAYLQISAATNATHYEFNLGNSYAGVGFSSATTFDPTTDLPLQFGILDNPIDTQNYVIRVYNGEAECFADVVVTLRNQDCLNNCSCTEYFYVNETRNDGRVHKYAVQSDGSLIEIFNNGNPWYPGSGISVLPSPHGLGVDLNGFIYIGSGASSDSDIRRLDCNGEIYPVTDFVIENVGTHNIFSVDNYLFVKQNDPGEFKIYESCNGDLVNEICLLKANGSSTSSHSWGFHIDIYDQVYIVSRSDNGYIYKYDAYELINRPTGECLEPTFENIEIGDGNVNTPGSNLYGITTDHLSNMYIVVSAGFGNSGMILKYDQFGNYVTSTSIDNVAGDGGWFGVSGLSYSSTCDCILTSNSTEIDDCVSVFNTDLSYIGAGVGAVGDINSDNTEFIFAKASAINTECCPIPNRQTINQVYCASGSNEQIFLNDIFPCESSICEGVWVPLDNASTAIYNDCNQSINVSITPACYSFIKTSDGLNNKQCGAFILEFNLEVIQSPDITVSADTTICNGDLTTLTVSTNSTDIQWQMSTSSCSDGFTDIIGATANTYQTLSLNDTTYYRIVINETADCSNESCEFESDCIAVNVDPSCNACKATNCIGLQLTKNN